MELALRAVEAGRLVIGRMQAPDAGAAIRLLLQGMESEDPLSARLRVADSPISLPLGKWRSPGRDAGGGAIAPPNSGSCGGRSTSTKGRLAP